MKITKRKQRLALLAWIAEGLSSSEIDEKAAAFEPPFSVTRQQVQYYKSTREMQLKAIKQIDEKTAMTEGYALKDHRVYKLSLLAALLEKDILGGVLWMNDVKGVGAGPAAEVVEFEYFNKAEVEAYRGVLDDIAAEVGGRIKNVDVKSNGEKLQNPETMKPSEIAAQVAALLQATNGSSGE